MAGSFYIRTPRGKTKRTFHLPIFVVKINPKIGDVVLGKKKENSYEQTDTHSHALSFFV